MENKPLKNKVVALTRQKGKNAPSVKMVESLGGKPYVVPFVEIKSTREPVELDLFIRKILKNEIELLIFLSGNSVKYILKRADSEGLLEDLLIKLRLIPLVCIGEKTADKLRERGIGNMLVPTDHSSEGLVKMLKDYRVRGISIGLPRSSKADDNLSMTLRDMGAHVSEVTAYQNTVPEDQERITNFINDLISGKVDAITFTSASTLENLVQVAEENRAEEEIKKAFEKVRVAVIGPKTGNAVEKHGINVDVTPSIYSIKAMIEALANSYNEEN